MKYGLTVSIGVCTVPSAVPSRNQRQIVPVTLQHHSTEYILYHRTHLGHILAQILK